MNIVALIVAIAAFLCGLLASFGYPRPPGTAWPGWLGLAVTLFIASFIVQLVFAPHGLVQGS